MIPNRPEPNASPGALLRVRGPRGVAAAALAASSLLFSLAAPSAAVAAPVLGSDWAAQWTTGRDVGLVLVEETDSASGSSSSGHPSINVVLPKGSSIAGTTSLSFDPATAAVRSSNTVDMKFSGTTDPSLGWVRASYVAVNQVSFSDQLTVSQDGFGFLKIRIKTHGTLTHQGTLDSAPYAYSRVEQYNRVMVDASLSNGEGMNLREEIRSQYTGVLDDVFDVSESRSVDGLTELIVTWLDAQPVGFSFAYSEVINFFMNHLDGEGLTLNGDNQLGNTVQIFADVYDRAGQWMPGVTVQSSSGIAYPSFGPVQPGTVPEPSSLALALVAGLGFVWRRRGS
jgi:hypothetical protein